MKAAQVTDTANGNEFCKTQRCRASKNGHHTLACVLGYAMGCALMLNGCASKAPPSVTIASEPETSYVYVLAPAHLMVHLDAQNPPLLAAEGLSDDLPVFASRAEARKWLETEVGNDRIISGLWRIYRLEGQWHKDVVQIESGECRMRAPAKILSVI